MAGIGDDGHDGRKRSLRGRRKRGRRLTPGHRRNKSGLKLVRVVRGGNWHIYGNLFGVRYRVSTFTDDFAIAEQEMARLVERAKTLYLGRGMPPKATFGEAVAGRLADGAHSDASRADCARWSKLIGADTPCEDVDWAMVRSLAESILRPGFKPSTLKRTVVEVRATLTWAHDNFGMKRHCPKPSFPHLEEGEPRNIYLKPRDVAAMYKWLLDNGEPLAAAVLAVCVCDGPRRAEAWNMRWEWVDLRDGIVTLRDTKGKDAATVRDRVVSDIRPWCSEVLRSLDTGRDRGAVFVMPNGRPFASEKTFGNSINRLLQSAAEAVGVEDWQDVTLHVLRHTAATNHYLLTRDIHDVQIRFDWRDIASAERYLKRVPKVYATQVEQLYGMAGNWQSLLGPCSVTKSHAAVKARKSPVRRPAIQPPITPLRRE